MKSFSFQVVACAGVMLAGGIASQAEGASNVLRNGVLWESTFEGDVADLTTSSPAWSVHSKGNPGTESTDGDIYSLVSGSTAVDNSYSNATNYSGSTARTIEIRARIPDNDFEASDGIASIIAGVNGSAYDLRFASTGLLYNIGGSGLTTVVTMDTSDFHVYRIVTDTGVSPSYSLYIDGATTPAYTSSTPWFSTVNPQDFDGLYFGDISAGGLSGRIDVDYISWTDNGAFAPVPEPSTALLGLAGLSLIARRRRA